MGFRIGVDVGGTFTDFLVASDDGKARIYKTSTTGANPAEEEGPGSPHWEVSQG